MASTKSLLTLALLATARLTAGHSAIISAVGDAGGSGMALGVDTATPRDGTRRNPFQQDSTRFRGDAADTVGETLAGGDNNLEAGTQAIMAETGDVLPQVSAGGELQMTLHQVNSDGAGPYTCMINADGTAQTWNNIQVTQNVPGGRNSRNRDGEATDFALTAAIPASQTCTGTVAGQDNLCLVRCENSARAGPFGGVVPVQMVPAAGNGADIANGNGNASNSNNASNNGNGNNASIGDNNNANGNNNANNNINNNNANSNNANNANANNDDINNNNATPSNAGGARLARRALLVQKVKNSETAKSARRLQKKAVLAEDLDHDEC